MKRVILIAAAGCLALTFPALAQNNLQNNLNGSSQPKSNSQQSETAGSNSQMGKQSQQQKSGQMQASNDQQPQTVQPSSLSRQEIREIQSHLDKSGFNAKRVDGIWGRETEDALRDFQQAKHLPGNGQLDQQTLSALGVNIGNQTQSASTNQNQKQQNASSSQAGQQDQSQTVGQSQTKGASAQGTGQNTKSK